jgi:hypothetical protein
VCLWKTSIEANAKETSGWNAEAKALWVIDISSQTAIESLIKTSAKFN